VPEGEKNLRHRIQEQTLLITRNYYGDSLGRLEDILRRDRAQLEDLAEQLPGGDAKARIRDMVDSYSKIEESLHQASREAGVEDAVDEATWQAQKGEANGPSEKRETTLELRPAGLLGPSDRWPVTQDSSPRVRNGPSVGS
jgi:hypothetical protein